MQVNRRRNLLPAVSRLEGYRLIHTVQGNGGIAHINAGFARLTGLVPQSNIVQAAFLHYHGVPNAAAFGHGPIGQAHYITAAGITFKACLGGNSRIGIS